MIHTPATKPDHLPRLRPGLHFTPISSAANTYFILEDTSRHLYYRIGKEEYLLLTYLNHSSSIEELLQKIESFSKMSFSKEQALTILGWLDSKQLLQTDHSEKFSDLLAQNNQVQKARKINRINLISFKIPLGNPNAILQRLFPWLGWLTGNFFAIAWLIAAFSALTLLFSQWPEFHSQTTGFFSPANLLIIWIIWLGLKILHEFFHALVCYRYGGKVYEGGILFILFIPLTYVDATSSWKFPSRWQRIHAAAAGMFAELGIAWLALIIWSFFPETTTGLIAHRTVLVAGISSLLFNANPLMRFDGYYILSDLMEIPNLYQIGLQDRKERFARLLLGTTKTSSATLSRPLFIRLYGIMVFLWRILVLASLGYLASKLFGGLGIIISLAALLIWISTPIHTFIVRWPLYKKDNPAVLSTLLLRGVLLLLITFTVINSMSWRRSIQAPAVVEYKHQSHIKTGTSGFVQHVLVQDGDTVTIGQPLLILQEPDLFAALHNTNLQLQKNTIRSRIVHNNGRIADEQILQQQQKALETKLQQQQEQTRALTVTSSANGTVIGNHLEELTGTYLKKGFEVLWVVQPQQKYLKASISQDNIEQMRKLIGLKIKVDMRDSGLGQFMAIVKRITPVASTTLTHPGLAAKYGGPIDVLERRIKGHGQNEEKIQITFFTPRFTMEILPPPELMSKLWAGQIGFVQARGASVSLHTRLTKLFSQWLQRREK